MTLLLKSQAQPMGERGGRQPANRFLGIQPTCVELFSTLSMAQEEDSKQLHACACARARDRLTPGIA